MQATSHAGTIAIDSALRSREMREYFRGVGDSRRYAALRQADADWFATPADGSPRLIIEPVTVDYLEGLKSGGCAIAATENARPIAA